MICFQRAGLTAMGLVVALGLGGCHTAADNKFDNVHNGGPIISDKTWLFDHASDDRTIQKPEYISKTACPDEAVDRWTVDANFDKIQGCADAMKQLIDVRFAHFEDSAHAIVNDSNFFADAAALGLGSAGALVSGATSKILAATSTGVAGIKSKADEDLLYSTSIEVIINQMHRNRARWAMIIDKRLKATDPKAPKAPVAPAKDDTAPKPAEPYANMFEVANDLLAYDRAGSWTEAMASLKIESAAQANACENQRKADKAGTTTSQATEATCTGSTTSPSEQSPPSPPPAPKPVHDKPPKAAKVEAK